jgi:tRNA (guanine-N7-)-methyltransferase
LCYTQIRFRNTDSIKAHIFAIETQVGKDKLRKFAEFSALPNTFEYAREQKGRWNQFFKNERPIAVELACGKAEYTVGLARLHPEQNFIGMDVKGNRIWRGAKTAFEENLSNTAFLRAQIDRIEEYFATQEVSEFWITFADPHSRASRARKRLTHPLFLNRYRNISKSGKVHLKTDSTLLYDFTKAVVEHYRLPLFEDCNNVYQWQERPDELNIRTHYETLWLAQGKSIKYLCFGLPEKQLDWKNDYPDFQEPATDEGSAYRRR